MRRYKASILAVTLIILSIVLVTALSVSLAAIKQKNASLGSGKSNTAFQNADTGIEQVMGAITKTDKFKLADVAWPSGLGCNAGIIKGGGFSVELRDEAGGAIACNSDTEIYKVVSMKSTGVGANQESRAIEAAVALDDTLLSGWPDVIECETGADTTRFLYITNYDSSNVTYKSGSDTVTFDKSAKTISSGITGSSNCASGNISSISKQKKAEYKDFP